jgi:hypothetical protein
MFSPDGSTIASGSQDNTVRLWDGITGEPIVLQSNDHRVLPFSASDSVPLFHWQVGHYDPAMSLSCITCSGPDSAHIVPLCWLPHDIKPSGVMQGFIAATASHVAVGCMDGRIIVFEIRNVSLNNLI